MVSFQGYNDKSVSLAARRFTCSGIVLATQLPLHFSRRACGFEAKILEQLHTHAVGGACFMKCMADFGLR